MHKQSSVHVLNAPQESATIRNLCSICLSDNFTLHLVTFPGKHSAEATPFLASFPYSNASITGFNSCFLESKYT